MDRVEFVSLVALLAIWFILFKVIYGIRVAIYKDRIRKGDDTNKPSSENSFGISFVVILILIPFFSPFW